jgi:hypothetical protein
MNEPSFNLEKNVSKNIDLWRRFLYHLEIIYVWIYILVEVKG